MTSIAKTTYFFDKKIHKLSILLNKQNWPYLLAKYLKIKSYKTSILKNEAIRLFKKNSCINSKLVGFTFQIHNGMYFQRLKITELMVGHKIGEFVLTKRMGAFIHKDNKLAKKKEKQLKQIAAKSAARKNKAKKKNK